MLAFAEKISDDANAVTPADIGALRAAGFTEEQIVDIALCTSMRIFTTKLNASLGVEPDPVYKPGTRLIDFLPEVFG